MESDLSVSVAGTGAVSFRTVCIYPSANVSERIPTDLPSSSFQLDILHVVHATTSCPALWSRIFTNI